MQGNINNAILNKDFAIDVNENYFAIVLLNGDPTEFHSLKARERIGTYLRRFDLNNMSEKQKTNMRKYFDMKGIYSFFLIPKNNERRNE